MKIYSTYLIVVLVILLNSFTSHVEAQSNDSAYVLRDDDPIVAMLDSLQLTKYFACNNSLSDSCVYDLANYKTDYIPYFDELVYEARLAKLDEETPFDLVYNNSVKAYIDLYSLKRRTLVSRLIGLSQVYFPMIEEKLVKYNLPLELKYLAIVESAMNPNAVSKSGAGGLWQFMYPTGKMYGLEVNSYVDDRRDPLKATEAACRYFTYLYGMFGDWQMVLAAYNCGPGALSKAIRRSGNKKTYWEVRPFLPAETQGYVPAFIAVNYIMNYTLQHNIYPNPVKLSYFYADTVHVAQAIGFESISQVLDIPIEDLVFLNPSYKLKSVPAFGNYKHLYLPKDKVGAFINNETAIYTFKKSEKMIRDSIMFAALQSAPTKKYHTVRKGETISKIAAKYNCSVSDIKHWNKLKSNIVPTHTKLVVYIAPILPKQQTIVVSTAPAASDSVATSIVEKANTAPSSSVPNLVDKAVKVIYHTVQKGDTLWYITNKYKMESVDELMRINNLKKDDKLIPGGKLKVIVASN